ncbi:MAG TPA: hypothetical protein VMZ71_11215 [Gemmataceae bacterium]|nr:hypothetical protein [Gemmataceae bacterium]
MRLRHALATLAALFAGGTANAQDDKEKIATQAGAILKAHCYRCHSGEGSSTPYKFDVSNRDSLVNPDPVTKKVMVVAGDPEKSQLWRAIKDERMPQIGSPEKHWFGTPTGGQAEIVKKWITDGAAAFPLPGAKRAFVGPEYTLKAVLDFLRDVEIKAPRKVKQYRFFSLANVHNNPVISDEDLAYHRAALSKVINSVSWAARIVPPEAIDGEKQLVFAINLEDLVWDAANGNLWKSITDAYPYGLTFEDHPDQKLRALEQQMCKLSGHSYPIIRADWFIATASRPPLYHALLYDRGLKEIRDKRIDPSRPVTPENPKQMTAYDLEVALKVDVFKNFNNDKIARAGFVRSGVSAQNRLVERHDARFGAYWKSYDFLPDAGRQRLIRFPLGPQLFHDPELKNPYEAQAFRHDGGESIFNLPNGLQGYFLVNGKDERIDAGPIQVVSDNNRVSGSFEIVNGVSCMACHAHGVIRFGDTIRHKAAVFGAAAEKVRQIYPERKDMDKLLDRDEQKFMTAAEEATLRFLAVGDNAGKTLKDFREPVSVVSIDYRLRYLDLRTLATELDVAKPEDVAIGVGKDRMTELGLAHMLQSGGVIPRHEWESVSGYSLMQQLGRPLGRTPHGK